MKLSVIMPVYNEQQTIREILKRVRAVDIEKEIIVVDDGSTDGTRRILKDFSQNGIKIFHHAKNIGKGAAIRTGLEHVTGNLVIIQDADLELDPNEYHKLIEPIINGKTEVVYGSRELGKNKMLYLRFYLGGRLLTFITNILYKAQITDEPTCYKVFKTNVLKNIKLECTGFEFCPEVTAKICRQGYKIYEVPISYNPRSVQQGKKISWKDGVKAIYTLFKYRSLNGTKY